MRTRRKLIGLVLLLSLSIPFVLTAQPGSPAQPDENSTPHLADIMNAIQTRHIKLWYAGKAANWDLADFELRQLRESLFQAAVLYAGIPVNNVTTLATPMRSIEDAVKARDARRFSKGFAELTAGCNGCHASMARAFIMIRTPTGQRPPDDQLIAPGGRP